jgi:hypothetical protein
LSQMYLTSRLTLMFLPFRYFLKNLMFRTFH